MTRNTFERKGRHNIRFRNPLTPAYARRLAAYIRSRKAFTEDEVRGLCATVGVTLTYSYGKHGTRQHATGYGLTFDDFETGMNTTHVDCPTLAAAAHALPPLFHVPRLDGEGEVDWDRADGHDPDSLAASQ